MCFPALRSPLYMLPSCCYETSGGGACNCLSIWGRGLVSSWHSHVTPFSYYQWETSSCRAESTWAASVCQVVKCKVIDKEGMGNAKQDYAVLSFFKTPKCCILTVYIWGKYKDEIKLIFIATATEQVQRKVKCKPCSKQRECLKKHDDWRTLHQSWTSL